MFEMADTLQMRYEKVKRLKNKLGNQSKNIDADLKARLHHAMDRVQNPLEQTGKLLDRQYNSWRSEKSQFWIRAKFVMRENLIKEGLEKMERAMQTLDEAANDVFSEYVANLLASLHVAHICCLQCRRNASRARTGVSSPNLAATG